MNSLFGFGGILETGLSASQGFKGAKKATALPPPPPPVENLSSLRAEWEINEAQIAKIDSLSFEELDDLFVDMMSTKKLTSRQVRTGQISREKGQIIDMATSDYIRLIKEAYLTMAMESTVPVSSATLQKAIAEQNKETAVLSSKKAQIADPEEKLKAEAEVELSQFKTTVFKEALKKEQMKASAPPPLNLSYVGERNESNARTAFNLQMGRTPERIAAARKMARGEPLTMQEKVRAGIVTLPKPLGPKPKPMAVGGKSKKTRRSRRKTRKH